MVAKRRGCFLVGIWALSLFTWIAMAFINIQTWLIALMAIAVMALFDYSCHKICKRVFFGANYFIGVIATILIGSFLFHTQAVQLTVCTILMPLLYTLAVEIYVTTDDHSVDYDDNE